MTVTRCQWCRDLIAALGNNQPSPEILRWCAAWTRNENTRARYNPLATTQTWPNATNFNLVGVKNYATPQDGIAATIQTLSYDYPGYADIRAGLQTNDPDRSMDGLMRSPWGSNGASVLQHYRNGSQRLCDEPLRAFEGQDPDPEADPATDPAEGAPPEQTFVPPGRAGGSWDPPSLWEQIERGDSAEEIGLTPGGVPRTDAGATFGLVPDLDAALAPANEAALARGLALGAAGVLAIALGIIILLRRFVPSEQIIRQIARGAS